MKATKTALQSLKSKRTSFLPDLKRPSSFSRDLSIIGKIEVLKLQTPCQFTPNGQGMYQMDSLIALSTSEINWAEIRLSSFVGEHSVLNQSKRNNEELMEDEEPHEDIYGEFEEEDAHTNEKEEKKKDKSKDDSDNDDGPGGGLMVPVLEWIGGLFPKSVV